MLFLIICGIVILLLAGIFFRMGKSRPGLFDRKCPACREFIKSGATVCKHCGMTKEAYNAEQAELPASDRNVLSNPKWARSGSAHPDGEIHITK